MQKFVSIEQFRHVVATVNSHATYVGRDDHNVPVYDETRPRPTLTFTGTVKLHGTHAAIGFEWPSGAWYAQSREKVLSKDKDNAGFFAFLSDARHDMSRQALRQAACDVAWDMRINLVSAVSVTFFGEFCGPQVNMKAAIGQIEPAFYCFGVSVRFYDDRDLWLPLNEVKAAYRRRVLPDQSSPELRFITDFAQYSITIDFNHPEAALDELERLTREVEAQCPVAHALGQPGIGEGIVWSCTEVAYGPLMFKTKGAKHKGTRTQRIVDIAPEVMSSLQAFVVAVVTENRLQQGYDRIRDRKGRVGLDDIGEFLDWLGKDVMKEEIDTLRASGLARKQVMHAVNQAAKKWFMAQLSRLDKAGVAC